MIRSNGHTGVGPRPISSRLDLYSYVDSCAYFELNDFYSRIITLKSDNSPIWANVSACLYPVSCIYRAIGRKLFREVKCVPFMPIAHLLYPILVLIDWNNDSRNLHKTTSRKLGNYSRPI